MTKQIDPNDPRLTAYALGETEDPDLAAAVAADENLRAEVEAIRATAGLLAETYDQEPAVALTDEQRAAVLAGEVVDAAVGDDAAAPDDNVIRPPARFWRRRPVFAAAASVAAVLAVFWWFGQPVSVDDCPDCWSSGSTPRFEAIADALTGGWVSSVRGSRIEQGMTDRSAAEPPSLAKALAYAVVPPSRSGTAAEPPGYFGPAPGSPAEGPAAGAVAEAPALTSEGAGLSGARDAARESAAAQPRAAYAQPTQAPVEAAAVRTEGEPAAAGAVPATQKIVKNADMAIEVESVTTAIGRIEGAAAELGGYPVEKRTDFGAGHLPSASLVLAVPVGNFEALLQRIREASVKVLSEQATGRDATKEYVDLQSQIANLEATQARIRQFLDQAETVEEALQVNAQLKEIEGQLSQLKGQLNFLGQRAAYSTVTVDMTQTPPEITPTPTATATPTPTPTPAPAWQPGQTARGAFGTLSGILRVLTDLVIWLVIVVGPFLVPVALVWWYLRRRKGTAR